MDTLELTGVLLGIIYVLLQYRASVWMWASSMLMSEIYIYVNYINGLYANFVLQIIFTIMAAIGMIRWFGLGPKGKEHYRKDERLRASSSAEAKKRINENERPITSMPRRAILPLIIATIILAVATYFVLIHTGESNIPVFDSITLAINLTGTYMLIRKYYQEWICWMIVDPLMAVMYAQAGMWPSAILYVIFSVVVVFGYINWRRMAKETADKQEDSTLKIQN